MKGAKPHKVLSQTRPPRGKGRRSQILVALAVAGLLLFNFPLLVVWDQGTTLFGLPALPVALFGIWGALIAVLAWVLERPFDRPDQVCPDRHHDEGGPQ